MSFSKATLKRFNDIKEQGPPVGAYDPKDVKKEGALIFDKSDRFRNNKDDHPGPGEFNISSYSAFGNASIMSSSTPVKRSFSSFCVPGEEKHKEKPGKAQTHSTNEVKELEREIKQLLRDSVEKARLLTQRDDDIKKLEGRLHNAMTERTSQIAKIASLEKDVKDLTKSNDVLKNKISSFENISKKKEDQLQADIADLKEHLKAKEKDLSVIRVTIDKDISALLQDFLESENPQVESSGQESASEYKSVSKSLAEKIEKAQKGLECWKLKEKLKTEDLEKEITSLKAEIAKMETKDQQEKLKLEHDKQILLCKFKRTIKSSSTLKLKNWDYEDQIRFLKGEVFTVGDEKEDTEQQTFEAQAEIAGLCEKIEVLEESEEKLNENLRQMKEKCQSLEETLAEEKENNTKCMDEITETLNSERENYQKSLATLTESQDKERKNYEITQEQLEEKLTAGEQKLKSVLEEYLKDKAKVVKLEDKLLKAETSIFDLNKMVNCLTKDNNETMNKLNNVQNDLVLLKDICSCFENQNKALTLQLESLNESKKSLKSQLSEITVSHRMTMELYSQQINDLGKENEALIFENNKLFESVEEMSSLKNSLCEQLLQSDNSRSDLVEQHNQELEEKQKVIEDLASAKEEQIKQTDKLTAELADIKKQHDHLENEMTKVLSKNEVLSKEMEVLKEEKQKSDEALDAKVKSLTEQCSLLQQTLANTKLEMDKLEGDLKTQLENVKTLEELNETKSQKIEEQNDHLDALVTEMDIMKVHNKELKLLSEREDVEINNLNQLVNDLRCTIGTLTDDVNSKTAEVETLHEQVHHLNSELDQVHTLMSEDTEVHKALSKMHQTQIATIEEENARLGEDLKMQAENVVLLEHINQELKNENMTNKKLYNDRLAELEQRLEFFKKEHYKWQEMQSLHEIEIQEREVVITHLEDTCTELQSKLEQCSSQIDSEDMNAAKLEIDRWRSQYEELLQKVSPFMSQIDAFELERQILLGESKNAQAEIDKLGQEYAKLLGHQNHKQKIKHIEKMRTEKMALSKEVITLREINTKQKRTIDKLQMKLKAFENTKSFDPSKAFMHGTAAGKENGFSKASSPYKHAQSSPLKPGNRL